MALLFLLLLFIYFFEVMISTMAKKVQVHKLKIMISFISCFGSMLKSSYILLKDILIYFLCSLIACPSEHSVKCYELVVFILQIDSDVYFEYTEAINSFNLSHSLSFSLSLTGCSRMVLIICS